MDNLGHDASLQVCFRSPGSFWEDPFSEFVGFQKMPELADRCLIRYGFVAQVYSHEASHGFDVVENFLGAHVTQVDQLALKEVDAKHPFPSYR